VRDGLFQALHKQEQQHTLMIYGMQQDILMMMKKRFLEYLEQ
jgi:hypothetical protein